ncbi:hypothetical protein K438DRAFT_19141 [Mycena galopus ATCC 62051]|nr:hypothetical protein K438DRAFT_19141 [Mycena galopus ATCC 62051]
MRWMLECRSRSQRCSARSSSSAPRRRSRVQRAASTARPMRLARVGRGDGQRTQRTCRDRQTRAAAAEHARHGQGREDARLDGADVGPTHAEGCGKAAVGGQAIKIKIIALGRMQILLALLFNCLSSLLFSFVACATHLQFGPRSSLRPCSRPLLPSANYRRLLSCYVPLLPTPSYHSRSCFPSLVRPTAVVAPPLLHSPRPLSYRLTALLLLSLSLALLPLLSASLSLFPRPPFLLAAPSPSVPFDSRSLHPPRPSLARCFGSRRPALHREETKSASELVDAGARVGVSDGLAMQGRSAGVNGISRMRE